MAILKRIYSTKTTERHKEYQKYHKEATERKRKPLAFSKWSASRGAIRLKPKAKLRRHKKYESMRTKVVKKQLKEAGI